MPYKMAVATVSIELISNWRNCYCLYDRPIGQYTRLKY